MSIKIEYKKNSIKNHTIKKLMFRLQSRIDK